MPRALQADGDLVVVRRLRPGSAEIQGFTDRVGHGELLLHGLVVVRGRARGRVSVTDEVLRLVLRLDESRAALATYPATREFEMLADWLDLKPKIKIGSFDFSGFDEEEEEEDE